jgi:membrane associated rhomboid family serine protease
VIFGIGGSLLTAMGGSPYWRDHPITRGLLLQMTAVLLIQLLIGMFNPMIDNAAHAGGFLAGMVFGALIVRVPVLATPRERHTQTS